MKRILDLDVTRCVACGACAVACMDQNDFDVDRGSYRSVHVLERQREEGVACTYLSIACMHCDNAPCIAACPCGCLAKDQETGFTVADNTACIGCRGCAMACPFGAPMFSGEGKMVKCDGCNARVRAGLTPACVRICPFGALRLMPEEEYQGDKRAGYLRRLSGEG